MTGWLAICAGCAAAGFALGLFLAVKGAKSLVEESDARAAQADFETGHQRSLYELAQRLYEGPHLDDLLRVYSARTGLPADQRDGKGYDHVWAWAIDQALELERRDRPLTPGPPKPSTERELGLFD